jgi:hypothetical protein
VGCNHPAGAAGGAVGAVLAAMGCNLRRLLTWLRLLLRHLPAWLFASIKPLHA